MPRIALAFVCVVAALAASAAAQIESCPWTTLDGGLSPAFPGAAASVLMPFDDGTGPALYLGGNFVAVDAGGQSSRGVARWNGSTWEGVRGGVSGFILNAVQTLMPFDDGSGPALLVGGMFIYAGLVWSPGLAKLDAQGWSAIGTGPPPEAVMTTAMLDIGAGERLHVAGSFTTLAGQVVHNVARFENGAWIDLGQGLVPGAIVTPVVNALAVFDDGSGRRLYAAGEFGIDGAGPGLGIGRWSGQSWELVGGGLLIDPPMAFSGNVATSLAVFDDGTGPALFVAGTFTRAGGQPIRGIAKWDGVAWSAVGGGLSQTSGPGWPPVVRILGVFDDGVRPKLAVTSGYLQAGTITVTNSLALWDGVAWSSPATGFAAATPAAPYQCLSTWDDGTGTALYLPRTVATSGPATVSVLKLGCALSPTLRASQPAGSGGAVWLSNFNLTPGHAYRNLFSLTPSPMGTPGPFLGLSFADPGALIAQLVLPPLTPPFTFRVAGGAAVWGPFAHPPASIEAVCADVSGGALGAHSAPVTIVVQ